jgi:hypothetical protein
MPKGLAFVTNQELTLGEFEELSALAPEIQVEIYHMERNAAPPRSTVDGGASPEVPGHRPRSL